MTNEPIILTTESILAFSPVIIVVGAATLGMLGIAIKRHHLWNTTLMVIGLNAALFATMWVSHNLPNQAVTALFIMDGYACFYMALILVAALACTSLSHPYMETHPGNREELYLLLVLATAGGMVLVSSQHLAGLFIGLELLSLPLYGMAAYSFQRSQSLEAGVKYLVLSAVATAFLLFGMALLYAETGQLSYAGLQQFLASKNELPMLITVGLSLILVAFAFKLSLVPFHLWTPDVYEGSPVPVTAFLATVGKVAVVAGLLRMLQMIPALNTSGVNMVLGVVAGLSIIGGNLLALTQDNLKRLLAFSSIAHIGYLLIAFVANPQLQQPAIALYMLAYVVTNLAAFGVLAYISTPYKGEDVAQLDDYKGLFWSQPYPALVFSVALLSSAGIPLTAGFVGKFYVMLVGVAAAQWWLLGALAIGTVVGLYVYLRVMGTMYLDADTKPGEEVATLGWTHAASAMVLILTGILMVIIGAYPQFLMHGIAAATL